MQTLFTIIYAYRDRDVERINWSLHSLNQQNLQNFKVVFVDYGSQQQYSEPAKLTVEKYPFAEYHYVAHSGLLWNKSKALNYGINKADTDFIVISDADVLFEPSFSKVIQGLAKSTEFNLFEIGYLPESVETRYIENLEFAKLRPTHYGETFGIGLFPKEALISIGGLDPFFHFYGSEDADLNIRLQNSGINLQRCTDKLLFHIWHPRYPGKNEKVLTVQPRLTNVQRINQKHYLHHEKHGSTAHDDLKVWNVLRQKEELKLLEKAETSFEIENIKANVEHFLFQQLPNLKGVVEVIFKPTQDYGSFKFKIKTLLKRNTEPHLSLKEVNDLILNEIIFKYRHHNYRYTVSEDTKGISFCIDLDSV